MDNLYACSWCRTAGHESPELHLVTVDNFLQSSWHQEAEQCVAQQSLKAGSYAYHVDNKKHDSGQVHKKLYIPYGVYAKPIMLSDHNYAHCTIVIAMNVQVVIYYHHFTDASITIHMQSGAHLTLYLHSASTQYNQHLSVFVYQAEQAHAVLHHRSNGSISANMNYLLQGVGAQMQAMSYLHMQYSMQGSYTTMQLHQDAQTVSSCIVKGLVEDAASITHYGTIQMQHAAQKADAQLQSRHMLLGVRAQAYAVPMLEVLTDDVQCFHASAIGTWDKKMIFYMMSRGMSEQMVYDVLKGAFLVC